MMEIFFILMEIQEQKIVSGCKNPSWTFYIAVMHSTVCGCLFLWKEQMQMKLVLAEKPSVAQSLAKVLLAKILSNPVLHLHREYCKLGFHFSIFSSIAVGFSHSKLLIWVGKHLTTTVNMYDNCSIVLLSMGAEVQILLWMPANNAESLSRVFDFSYMKRHEKVLSLYEIKLYYQIWFLTTPPESNGCYKTKSSANF